MRWIFFVSFFLFSFNAWGAISILDIKGASYFEQNSDNSWYVYGGLAGDGSECSEDHDGDNFETCNSCKDCPRDTICNCNEKRIFPSLALRISFSSDAVSGDVLVRTYDDIQTIPAAESYPTNVKVSSAISAKFYWKDVCVGLNAGASCGNILPSIISNPYLLVGIDGNQDGDLGDSEDDHAVLYFRVYKPPDIEIEEGCADGGDMKGVCAVVLTKGDQKAVLEDIFVHEVYPVVKDDLEVKSIRFFYSKEGFPTDPTNKFVDFGVDDIAEAENLVISGLDNGERHFFRFAIIDRAENIAFFQSRALFESQCPSLDRDCDYAVTPEEVNGFLKKSKNCFIATATLGSPLHPHLEVFREFRNRFLLSHSWGRAFVLSYYRWGSRFTHVLENHPYLKIPLRALLWVLWLMAWLFLHPYIFFSLILSFIAVYTFHKRKKLKLLAFLIGLFISSSGEASFYKNKLFSFQSGFYHLKDLKNEEGELFTSFYENHPIVFLTDFEIPLKKGQIQLGLKFGTGLTYSLGKGKFKSDNSEAKENFYFFVMPNRVSLIARMKLPKSLLLPFGEAGGGYSVLLEKRTDGLDSSIFGKQAGAVTFHWATGMALDLAHDRRTQQEIDEDYGLKLVYLYVEYRNIVSLRKEFDVSSKLLTVGFVFGV